ncbi:hypothetical protein SAMN02745866_01943 [Alteromonadaceae bacterium Bs31]|nr:hypothetical protein SAMN02745866_01943 [Alteromonadaceae bacterium Bs31]
MSESSYSEILRELSRNYYNRSISINEYRVERHQVLDAIDHQYNGVDIEGLQLPPGSKYPEQSMTTAFYSPTDTQPNFQKK